MKRSDTKLLILAIIVFLAVVLTVPVLSKIPQHPDEYQFYLNAFQMMAGKSLNNYLHVALTEYALTGYLSIINLFTDTGVNFPQGDPSNATYFYGRIYGFILYMTTFLLAAIILQRNESRIKMRTIIFAVLYFGSLGMFERFLRVNSDSTMIFVFLNFVILSLWLHRKRAGISQFFVLNALFLFLGTFTNLKAVFLMFPLLALNTCCPFVCYGDKEVHLSKLYRFIMYGFGIVTVAVFLWVIFMPKPFDYIKFWYGIKQTIVHGSAFDFDYPSQARNSGVVYIYDLLAEYFGFTAVGSILVLAVIAYLAKGKALVHDLVAGVKSQLKLEHLFDGNLYKATEVIIFMSFIFYYIGVSSRTIHWSRWGAPLGITAFIFISTPLEKLVEAFLVKLKRAYWLFIPLVLFAWLLRFMLTVDLANTDYPKDGGHAMARADIDQFLREKAIAPELAKSQVTWFTGYTDNVANMSLEGIMDPANKDIQYVLWPYWNLGAVYEDTNVNIDDNNLKEFIKMYAQSVEYRFPSLLSRYEHLTKLFAWKYLKVTWNPEIDSLVENQYAAVKIKKPLTAIQLTYNVGFTDMAHYYFPYSLLFNMKTLTDGYTFPPCYSYPDARYMSTGQNVLPPAEIGIGARTAGLYCHSLRFRVFLKGKYLIQVVGLPPDIDAKQIVYFNLGNYYWDPATKTAGILADRTIITAEFGVALPEKYVPDLKFRILYLLE